MTFPLKDAHLVWKKIELAMVDDQRKNTNGLVPVDTCVYCGYIPKSPADTFLENNPVTKFVQ